jgi:protein-S-isoprenylcysteine O-methyltransferase Ste14
LLAWITFIALVLLNIEVWFSDPWSLHQVISWVLLLLSVAAVTWGAISLKLGQSGYRRVDRTLIGFEGTTQLIEFGAYRYVRHPMYSSFLLGGLGVLLKDVSWPGVLLTSVVFLCAILAAIMEEQENIRFFGHAYASHMKRTKMFLPLVL